MQPKLLVVPYSVVIEVNLRASGREDGDFNVARSTPAGLGDRRGARHLPMTAIDRHPTS